MRETMLTEYASRQTTVRQFLEEYRSWICSKLGCEVEEVVLLELDFPMVQVAARNLLPGVRLRSEDSSTIRELQKLLKSVDLPPDSYPIFEVHLDREPRGRLASRRMVLKAEWQGGPAALWLRGFPGPVVAASIPIVQLGRGNEESVIVCWSTESVHLDCFKSSRESPRDGIVRIYMYLAAAIDRSAGLLGMIWC
jgi:hypothetical protein